MKILKRTGLVFLSLIALLGIWIGVNSIDDRELSPEAQEMLKPFPEVPPEENGYEILSYMNQSGYLIFKNDDERKHVLANIKGTEWDTQFINETFFIHKDVMRDAVLALQKPKFKFPSPKKALDLPRYQYYYDVSRLFNLKTKYEANELQIDNAIATLATGTQYCQKVFFNEYSEHIAYTLGNSCISKALGIAHEISSKQQISNTQRIKLLELNHIIPEFNSDHFENIFPSDLDFYYKLFEEEAEMSIKEKLGRINKQKDLHGKVFSLTETLFPSYYFHINAWTNLEAKRFSVAMNDAPLFCNKIQSMAFEKSSSINDFDYQSIWKPYWLNPQPWFYTKYFQERCLAHTYYDAVKTIIALHSYEHDHQALPKELNELVPTYLDKLPVDYFDGQTLRYSPEHRWLYSVGTDFNDDKGSKEGFNKGACYDAKDKQACNTNPTFPIDWNAYPASMK